MSNYFLFSPHLHCFRLGFSPQDCVSCLLAQSSRDCSLAAHCTDHPAFASKCWDYRQVLPHPAPHRSEVLLPSHYFLTLRLSTALFLTFKFCHFLHHDPSAQAGMQMAEPQLVCTRKKETTGHFLTSSLAEETVQKGSVISSYHKQGKLTYLHWRCVWLSGRAPAALAQPASRAPQCCWILPDRECPTEPGLT